MLGREGVGLCDPRRLVHAVNDWLEAAYPDPGD